MFKNKAEKTKIIHALLYMVIPFVLVCIWIGSSIYTLLTYNASFTILPYSHPEKNVISPRQATLVAGTTLKGEITAKENNLGAIAVRLHNFHGGGVEEDRIIFRFKEKGSEQWYYEHEYTGGQFHELDLFPFGFPIIRNSEGKQYIFEIQSRYGYDLTSIDLTNQNPIVVSEYQFPKNTLLHNKQLLQSFVKKKITYQLQNLDVKLLLLVFPIPLILYLLGISPIGKAIYRPTAKNFKKIKYKWLRKKIVKCVIERISLFDFITLLILFINVIFINGPNETIIVELFILVFVKTIIFEAKDYNEFPAALFFLILCSLMLAIHYKPAAERAAIWTYVFLLIGTGRLMVNQLLMRK